MSEKEDDEIRRFQPWFKIPYYDEVFGVKTISNHFKKLGFSFKKLKAILFRLTKGNLWPPHIPTTIYNNSLAQRILFNNRRTKTQKET